MTDERLVAVALPLPLQTTFTYRLPAGGVAGRGVRVVVPFAGRRAVGVVTGPAPAPEGIKVKNVEAILDEASLLPPPLLDLAAWVADYYMAPPGECYRLAFPAAGIRTSRATVRLAAAPKPEEQDPLLLELARGPLRISTLAHRIDGDPSARLLRLRQAGDVVLDQDLGVAGFREQQFAVLIEADAEPKGSAQRELVARLRAASGRAAVADIVADKPSLRGSLKSLLRLGRVRLETERVTRSPEILEAKAATALDLSADQAEATLGLLDKLERRQFASVLLHGVTSSGKTEVYFRCIEAALGGGRGALMLVPEISLTPMLVRAAVGRFGSTVSVLHSELSAGERHDQWWRIREGESRVVIGARSAVFAPVVELGVIVVDEEHESSYKQEDSPRYHARDVAVYRARLEGALVLLGSATPSLESFSNAQAGKYGLVTLGQRIGARPLPKVEIVDRRAMLRAGGDPILSDLLVGALETRLRLGEQALLLLNRRGYATSLLCRECGQQLACPNCSVALAVHEAGRSSECHYCGYRSKAPSACGACHGEYLKLSGHGTEKVVEALKARLPQARVDRLDRDTARRRGAVAGILEAFERGGVDVLVGTQMIAKGHDFPNVTLVGVIDADVGLGLPDFRSAERTFQLLTQVAGRAGRGHRLGEVILQSHQPEHYALRLACAQDYLGFYAREMEFRTTMAYPPAGALIEVVFRSRDLGDAMDRARRVAAWLRQRAGRNYRVLGPALAPLARLQKEHRCQIVLKGNRGAMRTAVRAALDQLGAAGRGWRDAAVDVDPVSLM